MIINNKLSLSAARLLLTLTIVFLIYFPAAAQVSSSAVSISFKKPFVPLGIPDPFKKWWFQHSFGVGEYHVDVSAAAPLPVSVEANRSSVFLSGKDARAVVFTGNTAEICGEALVTNRYFCLPLKEGSAITKLDIFAKVKEVKARKNRLPNRVTIWEGGNFTGRNLDLGIGINDVSNLDFNIINSVWVPAGYWAMFCMNLSDDRKLCGPGRGFRSIIRHNDINYLQATHPEAPRLKYKYVLVGTGEPPPDPKKIVLPGQNDYFPATESKPVVLDHIVKAQYLPGEGYEPESRREFQLGKSAFSIRIKKSGGYWYVSVYQGFKVSVGLKNVRTGSIVPQEVLYEGKHKLNLKSKLWEVTGLLEGEMMIEKDTRPKMTIPDVNLPPKIKTKPFPKPKPNISTTRTRKN